ncbi:MAG: PIN domain-containing protein [Bacteroidetes bacterium]|nr:MAG: PIN domain-containing protein [Bacteroidota bacterium]
MVKYLLDTNICIYIIKQKPIEVFEKFKTMQMGTVGISAITFSELIYGVEKSSHPEKNRDALLRFVAPLEVLDYNEEAASEYGKIRTIQFQFPRHEISISNPCCQCAVISILSLNAICAQRHL